MGHILCDIIHIMYVIDFRSSCWDSISLSLFIVPAFLGEPPDYVQHSYLRRLKERNEHQSEEEDGQKSH